MTRHQSIRPWTLTVLLACALSCNAETVIPLKFAFGNHYTDGYIGDRKVELLVDLGGAGFLFLDQELVKTLRIATTKSGTSNTNLYGETRETFLFSLPMITIGEIQFNDIPAFTRAEFETSHTEDQDWWPQFDGTIGREFLKQYIVVFDYLGSTLTLSDYDDAIVHGCGDKAFPLLEHEEGIIVSGAKVDHGNFDVIWDTGATYSFIKSSTAAARSLPLGSKDEEYYSYISRKFIIGGVDFGPLEFVALPVVQPERVDLIIGHNFFNGHVICVDAKNSVMSVEKSEIPHD